MCIRDRQETEQTLGAHYVTVTGTESPEEIVAKVSELIERDIDVVGVRTMAAALDRALAAKLPGVLAEVTRKVLTQHRIGGLYATGGDIATAITTALDTDGFVIDDEVVPLAVVGRLCV